jgi:hypothetical protein
VTGATWGTATRIVPRVGDLVQRTGDGQAQIGYSVAERSGGQVTSCAVCTVHMKIRSAGFWFSLKTKIDGFPVCASKLVAPV